MEKALIGALLAGAAGVWLIVIVKLVQQRAARVRRRNRRESLDARVHRLDPQGSSESPESGPAGW